MENCPKGLSNAREQGLTLAVGLFLPRFGAPESSVTHVALCTLIHLVFHCSFSDEIVMKPSHRCPLKNAIKAPLCLGRRDKNERPLIAKEKTRRFGQRTSGTEHVGL